MKGFISQAPHLYNTGMGKKNINKSFLRTETPSADVPAGHNLPPHSGCPVVWKQDFLGWSLTWKTFLQWALLLWPEGSCRAVGALEFTLLHRPMSSGAGRASRRVKGKKTIIHKCPATTCRALPPKPNAGCKAEPPAPTSGLRKINQMSLQLQE